MLINNATCRLLHDFPGELEAVVVVDTPIGKLTPEDRAAREHAAFGPLRTYPTEQGCAAR
jgi:hypothetical protein